MKILRHIDKAVARVEAWLTVILLWLMVLLTFLQIMLRALYTHAHMQWANLILGQIDWAEPLARLLVLWITLLGASLLTRDHKHIKIDLMSAILPPKWLPLRELILSVACVLVCTLMLKASVAHIKMEMAFGGHLFLNLPTWAGQMILPLGFSLILFRFFLRGVEQAIGIFRRGMT